MSDEQRSREAQIVHSQARSEHEKVIDRVEKLQLFLGNMEVGSPRFEEQVLSCLEEITAILDHLLKYQPVEKKRGDEDGG